MSHNRQYSSRQSLSAVQGHAEMLGISDSDTKYRKRDKNVHNIDIVNEHLADTRLSALGDKEEVPITSENGDFHAPKELHPCFCALLQQKENL